MKKLNVKEWMKDNWMYVAGGVATAGAIGLAIWKGLKSDTSVGEPFVIDKSKDDWMDQLTTYGNCGGKPLTVRQVDALAHFAALKRVMYKDKGIITNKDENNIVNEIMGNPDNEYIKEVLDTIEGFWGYVDKDGNKIEVEGS